MSRSVHETETRVCVHPRVVSPNLVARRARACPMCCTPRKRNESETGAAEREPREVRRLHRGVSRGRGAISSARERSVARSANRTRAGPAVRLRGVCVRAARPARAVTGAPTGMSRGRLY